MHKYFALRHRELDSWDLSQVEAAVHAQDGSFLVRVQQLLPEAREKFAGGLLRPQPSPLAEKLHELCELYLCGSPDQRAYIRWRIDWGQAKKLRQYSEVLAVLGLHARSEQIVRLGLVALAIENLTASDAGDAWIHISLLSRAAAHVGADPCRLLGEVAAISGPGVSAMLLDFLNRLPTTRSPA